LQDGTWPRCAIMGRHWCQPGDRAQ
jgi:hypothetical protein